MRFCRTGSSCAISTSGSAVDRQVDRRQAEVVHAPAVVQRVIERDVRDLRRCVRGLLRYLQEEAVEIDPVEADDEVGIPDDVLGLRAQPIGRRHRMLRMIGRKHRPLADRGQHRTRRHARPARRGGPMHPACASRARTGTAASSPQRSGRPARRPAPRRPTAPPAHGSGSDRGCARNDRALLSCRPASRQT